MIRSAKEKEKRQSQMRQRQQQLKSKPKPTELDLFLADRPTNINWGNRWKRLRKPIPERSLTGCALAEF